MVIAGVTRMNAETGPSPRLLVAKTVHACLIPLGTPRTVIGLAVLVAVRESPADPLARHLLAWGADVRYHDPFIPELDEHGADTVPSLIGMRSVEGPIAYDSYDAVVIVTDHTSIDYTRLLAEAPLIIDTRNALKKASPEQRARIVKL